MLFNFLVPFFQSFQNHQIFFKANIYIVSSNIKKTENKEINISPAAIHLKASLDHGNFY